MTPRVKICGLTTPEAVEAAATSGADYLGFIFYPPSPRHVTPERAAELAALAPSLPAVAVTVDADDATLEGILRGFAPAYFQLHGNETPARLRDIKTRFGLPVIKAFAVRTGDDIASAHAYEAHADFLLFDARAPKGLPGGNGLAFDWRLLSAREFGKPWFLSGGLNADNVEEALRIGGAPMVDVSSSVESAPGVKDPARVRAFITKVKSITL